MRCLIHKEYLLKIRHEFFFVFGRPEAFGSLVLRNSSEV